MRLLEPGRIGNLEVKNRIVMAAMGTGGGSEPDGTWSDRVREYFVARARGGTGLITTMLVFVNRDFEPASHYRFLNLYDDRQLAALRLIVSDVHRFGCRFCVQLTAGFGRVMPPQLQDAEVPPISASENSCYFNPHRVTRGLTTDEVSVLSASFGLAAARCRAAGVDAVELHGHEGYLLDQFMTALWNKRTDRYGGSEEKRLTFAREAIAAIHADAGEDFPIIYRFGLTHHLRGGRGMAESLRIASKLEAAGVAALHIDAGCYEAHEWAHPTTYQAPGFLVDLAAAVKQHVKIPIIAVGKLGYPELAERTLEEGKADFIAIGRGLLADPEWPNKVRDGKSSLIRPCIGDNMSCLIDLISDRPTSCTVNPQCGHEIDYGLVPIKGTKAVLVIGGGPAGLEAARVAALRGFNVKLWEKAQALGGNLRLASVPDFKHDLRLFLDYQIGKIRQMPAIEVSCSKMATDDDVVAEGADYVIVATGATLQPPDVPGLEGRTTDAVSVLNGQARLGRRVLVVGGGLIGVETALYLARKKHKVTLASRRLEIDLEDAHPINRRVLKAMVEESRMDIKTCCELVCGIDGGILLDIAGIQEEFPLEMVVFCRDMRPDNVLAEALSGRVKALHLIGDCVTPRTVKEAIWEAFHAARNLGIAGR